MNMERLQLVQHLRRVACEGRIKEAVFSGAFASAALTADHQLLVLAPPLQQAEPVFPAEGVGVGDVEKLIRVLSLLAAPADGGTGVEIHMEANRLVIDEHDRGVMRLLTAAPKTIGTRIEAASVAELLTPLPTEGGIPLTRTLIEGVRSAFGLFKAAEVQVFVGPEGGKIRVGNDNSDMAEFPSEAFTSDEEYSLLFGGHLIDVLSVVTDYSTAVLRLSGPEKPVVVEDGSYRYIMSPRVQGATGGAGGSKVAKADSKSKKKKG